jgi:predicted GNAT family N-acyltransferase
MSVVLRIATSPEELRCATAVRAIVFCCGQRIPYDTEYDGHDEEAVHAIGMDGSEPVAAGRIRFIDGDAKLERIAVRMPWRGRGIGHRLVDFMIAIAAARGCPRCRLNSQAHLQSFYEAHGFRVCGEHFEEAGIDHVPMVREGPVISDQ